MSVAIQTKVGLSLFEWLNRREARNLCFAAGEEHHFIDGDRCVMCGAEAAKVREGARIEIDLSDPNWRQTEAGQWLIRASADLAEMVDETPHHRYDRYLNTELPLTA